MTTDMSQVEPDWVAARAECSVSAVFQRLFSGVRRDVDARNAQFREGQGERCELTQSTGQFTVTRLGADGRQTVRFTCTEDTIRAEGDGVQLEATLTFTEYGNCLLRTANGFSIEEWQFRMLALEKLFFGSTVARF